MKKLLALIVSLLLVVSLQAQRTHWGSTVSSTTSLATLIGTIKINDDVRKDGKFQGVFALHLDVDSLGLGDGDSLLFWPLYYYAGGNVQWGDTIQWYIMNTDSIGNAWNDSTTYVIPKTQQDNELFWATDPRFPFSGIEKYPYYKVGVYIISIDSANFKYDLEVTLY